MRALLDVNVLIALSDQEHVHHQAATAWFRANDRSGWASCPLTQNGALRVMCQPAYPNPSPFSELADRLRGAFRDEHHRFWPDDLSLLDEQRFVAERVHGHRQLTDVYLLALALKHGGRLVTLDTAVPLSAVRGAKPEHLVRIAAT
jgi:toxin-antitoxin system PIN domain toxin